MDCRYREGESVMTSYEYTLERIDDDGSRINILEENEGCYRLDEGKYQITFIIKDLSGNCEKISIKKCSVGNFMVGGSLDTDNHDAATATWDKKKETIEISIVVPGVEIETIRVYFT